MSPDSALARRTGRTKEVVAERERRRVRLPTPPRRWTAGEIKMLGRYPDLELTRRFGRSRADIRRERLRLGLPPFRITHFKNPMRKIR
jgi:hypothetical protein